MRRFIALTLLCISAFAACRQPSSDALEAAKMEMIREGAVFYCNDAANCSVKNINELKDCLKGCNGESEAFSVIDRWNEMPVNDTAALRALGDSILRLVPMAHANEERNFSISNQYNKHKNKVNYIITHALLAPKAGRYGKEEMSDIYAPLLVLGLIMSIGAIIICFFLWKKQKNLKDEMKKQYHSDLSDKNADLITRISSLETELKSLNEMFTEADARYTTVLRKFQNYMEEGQSSASVESVGVDNKAETIKTQIKWAKYPNGNGFNIDGLVDEPGPNRPYELTITGQTDATFRISSNRDAQLFALRNPADYLDSACEYDGIPNVNNTINTTKPGKLNLEGNSWMIVTKAKIIFK